MTQFSIKIISIYFPKFNLFSGGMTENILGANTTNLITIWPPSAELGPVRLPQGVYGHCTVLIKDKIYIIGGYWMDSSTSDRVLSIEIDNGAMEYVANLNFGRIHHGCATFMYGNKPFVIVAGANRAYNSYYSVSKTSEIFDVTDNIWIEGTLFQKLLQTSFYRCYS